jgi:GDP-L-fucose synthase
VKVFIAGHKGLVGSALNRTAPAKYQIVTASKNELDLRNKTDLKIFLRYHEPDVVILAAARVGGIYANSRNQKSFLVDNLDIQNSVMTSSSECKIKNLIFMGSSCVYPKFASQPISEDALLTGELESSNQGYALAKISGIHLCKAISEEENLNYFTLMPTNLFGPNDNFDLATSHVPAALLRRFHEAKIDNLHQVSVWGSGAAMREFMHSEDLASATWHMMGKKVPGEIINVGTGKEISIKDFAYLVAKIVGYKGEIIFDTAKPDGTPRKLLNVQKIHSYGWSHNISLSAGLESTYSWLLNSMRNGTARGF